MKWYYLNESGEVVGPISEETLKELRRAGALKGETQVCREGTEEWVTLAEALGADSPGDTTEESNTDEVSAEPPHSAPPESLESGLDETSFGSADEPANAPESAASSPPATNRIKAGWAGVKRNSKIAALHAQIEKLRNLDLRKAHHALGKRCYELELLKDQLGQSFDAIREVEARIVADRESEQAPDDEKMADSLKRMASRAAKATHAQALNLKLPPLLTELGRLAYPHNEQGNLPGVETEVEAIGAIETQIRQKESEIENMGGEPTEAGKGEAMVATPPPLTGQSVNSPDTTQKAAPPRQTAPPISSKVGNNPRLKFIMIGCGAAAILSIIVVVSVISMMVGGGNAGGSKGTSTSTSSSPPSSRAEHYNSACRRCKGTGQLRGQCTRCRGNGTIMTGSPNSLDPLRSRNPPMQVPCPQCRGDGRMPVPCSHCRGTGKS